MHELECRSCGYKFKSAKIPPRCPYCSKEAVGLRKGAQDLIDETLDEVGQMDEERSRRN
ncbi:MAG: hypothetical protein AABX00_00900 [Nanoarchaeota archaeon]